jgi:hypothetical protein
MPVLNKNHRLQWFVMIALLAISCNRSNNSIGESSPFPYPSTEQQRNLLASKNLLTAPRLLDSIHLIKDLEYLSSDLCEGRKPGTAGHQVAFNYIRSRMKAIGLDSISSLEQTFTGKNINGTTTGKNLIGLVKGTEKPDKYIVISAHYDHLGKDANNNIYYGADDNASGVATLLAIGAYLENHPAAYSVMLCALDREETGFEGAYSFVNTISGKINLTNIVLNINMDMIARADRNEIFVCGLLHDPSWKYLIEKAQDLTNIHILMGHDGGTSGKDWSRSSDHAAFMGRSIPFLYFGVEDHADYHQPTDDLGKINYSRFTEISNMMNVVVRNVR